MKHMLECSLLFIISRRYISILKIENIAILKSQILQIYFTDTVQKYINSTENSCYKIDTQI